MRETGIEPRLVEGDDGAFDVLIDDELVHSKRTTGRFPTDDQIIEIVRERSAALDD